LSRNSPPRSLVNIAARKPSHQP